MAACRHIDTHPKRPKDGHGGPNGLQDFGDALHSPDKFLKVTSAQATAVDVVDGGGTIISRLFQAQVVRRGSGQNGVVECPFWAVVQGKGGGATMGCLRCALCAGAPPPTHNRLLLCSIDALGQLQRWKQCEWSDVRAIAPAPHLNEAAQAFLLRFQKQLVGRGPKGEKGGRVASDASGDPSLQSKGRTEQQTRGSRRPRPTTTPREAAQAAQAAGDGRGGTREGGDSPPGGGKQAAARAAEGDGGRPQHSTGRAHR